MIAKMVKTVKILNMMEKIRIKTKSEKIAEVDEKKDAN